MIFKNSGVQALFITNITTNVVRLLSNLLLARFLSPEDFAITGLAISIIFAFNMLSDGGFRSFIIRNKNGEDINLLGTLWTTKFIRNVFLAIILFFTSDSIASYFAIKELELVLKILCLNFILDAIRPISNWVAERQNKVATVMYLEFTCYILSILVMIIGTYHYRTFWPIIAGILTNELCKVVGGYWILGRKGTFLTINTKVLKEFFHWAKFIMPSSFITLLLMQLDKMILGKTLTVVELGLYYVAFNFSSAALTVSTQFSRKVLMPQMSKEYREKPETFIEKYYSFKLNISLVLALFLGLLSGISYIFFDLLYDERYINASYFLSILLLVPILSLISYPAEATLIIYGYARMTLIANTIRLAWFAVGGFIGFYYYGVWGLLIAISLIELLPSFYMLYRMHHLSLLKLTKELMIISAAIFGFFIGSFINSVYTESLL